ncbi:hypothetical protein KJ365_10480 [Glaciecola sp. XM2]|uniref:capsular polysaccharide export protein, LipB/KpsS family n=1 Tax=Glaciecola sp. XM2 TaxID=1914931 RepID=UPI001BDDD80D|nr:hypothetical protein [Glaciecola sp. XM2]
MTELCSPASTKTLTRFKTKKAIQPSDIDEQDSKKPMPIYAELTTLKDRPFFIVCTRKLYAKLSLVLQTDKALQTKPVLLIDSPDALSEKALVDFALANKLAMPINAIVTVCEWGSIKLSQAIDRWAKGAMSNLAIFDATAQVLGNSCFYKASPVQKYVILYSLNPVEQYPMWLKHIEAWLNSAGIELILRHPLQNIDIALHQQSEGALLWNGSLNTFDSLKHTLAQFKIPFSFVECGFFTQKEHVYFDKQGINLHTSLANDNLDWVPNNYAQMVDKKAHQLFDNVEAFDERKDYIFIPLQLGHDSNIQLNSSFTSGMQAFIDYIEATYPYQTLVFKAHPLDTNEYALSNTNSYWSTASSLSLIKSAKCVHGINSTVLFESTLYGVPTIFEGDSLLVRHSHQPKKLLAALLCKQISISSAHTIIDEVLENIGGNSCVGLG